MRIATFEVQIRIDSVKQEHDALMDAKRTLMDVPGALAVVNMGNTQESK